MTGENHFRLKIKNKTITKSSVFFIWQLILLALACKAYFCIVKVLDLTTSLAICDIKLTGGKIAWNIFFSKSIG